MQAGLQYNIVQCSVFETVDVFDHECLLEMIIRTEFSNLLCSIRAGTESCKKIAQLYKGQRSLFYVIYHLNLLPEAMSLQPKGSGKPSQKQTLKRSKVRVKSQQMSGRGSSQGQSRTKTRYFAAADLLQIYQIRWTTHSTIIAGEIFPNTLPRVHHCTL